MSFHFIDNIRRLRRALRKDPGNLFAMNVIPEKAMKGDARSHQTTYVFFCKISIQIDNNFRLGNLQKIECKDLALKADVLSAEPIATFNFKYRSRCKLAHLPYATLLIRGQ